MGQYVQQMETSADNRDGFWVAWVVIQVCVGAVWLVTSPFLPLVFGYGLDDGRPGTRAIFWLPWVGVAFWLVQYIGTARSKRVRQVISWAGFAVVAGAWILACATR